ncbi:plancitoxin-1 isoform X2 [Venturia canescens]|uniref:plancitoxin-1 isoform X2 n=1 Tax=Venturia canescens TaxID=32260 RepID=UPI001C9C3C98|nr:plancitoxin-1 isoform X2 [Venturia canescens]
MFLSVFQTLYHLFVIRSQAAMQQQCRDEDNEPVDWFVMYKIPKIRESSLPDVREGISYLYITDKTVGTGWKLSTKDVTSKNSIPARTLAPLYNDKLSSKLLWVMYNDQPPDGRANANYGHAKGVVMTNGESGFWLIHSVPGFPLIPNSGESRRRRITLNDTTEAEDKVPEGEYGYPDTGRTNGQSFMCISVNSDQIDVISQQLMYNQIIVYRKNLPESTANGYPSFVDASNQVRIRDPPYNKKAVIRSTLGLEFTSFAKSDKWQRELYDDFVGPQLNSDLLVESWQNGRGKLPSECNGSRVLNIESINLREANVVFTSTHDHSKWAVSMTNGKHGNWVCVGDINRAETQFSRGGGTVCLKSPDLWKYYRNVVNDMEPCPKKNVGIFGKLKHWFSSKFG